MKDEKSQVWILDKKEEAVQLCEKFLEEGVSFELHSPYLVSQVNEKLKPSRAGRWCLSAAIFGFCAMFILVWWSTYDYLHNVAGQPSIHPPYFLLSYVGLIFCGTLGCFFVFLYEGGLLFYDSDRKGDQLFSSLLEGKFIVEVKTHEVKRGSQ